MEKCYTPVFVHSGDMSQIFIEKEEELWTFEIAFDPFRFIRFLAFLMLLSVSENFSSEKRGEKSKIRFLRLMGRGEA